MIDPTLKEIVAMHSALPALGDYIASIGMERPLSAYSKEEVLALVEVVITAYLDYLQAHPESEASS